MLLATMIKVSSSSGCAGLMFMLMFGAFIFGIVTFINKVAQQSQNMSGGSIQGDMSGNLLSGLNDKLGGADALRGLGGTLSQRSSIQPTSSAIPGVAAPYKRKGQPINWKLIKMNLTKDQIKECFDMSALSKGVKKKDLPNFVFLDRLRNYLTETQLQHMLDMEFFEGVARPKSKRKSLDVKLTGLGTAAAPKAKETAKEIVTERVVEKTSLKRERVSEFARDESAGETVPEEQVHEEVEEKSAEELVYEAIKRLNKKDPLFGQIADNLSFELRQEFAIKMNDILDESKKKPKTRTIMAGDMVNGIIWSEILKRKSLGNSGSILSRRF